MLSTFLETKKKKKTQPLVLKKMSTSAIKMCDRIDVTCSYSAWWLSMMSLSFQRTAEVVSVGFCSGYSTKTFSYEKLLIFPLQLIALSALLLWGNQWNLDPLELLKSSESSLGDFSSRLRAAIRRYGPSLGNIKSDTITTGPQCLMPIFSKRF